MQASSCGHVGECGCAAGGECCLRCPLPECVFDFSDAKEGRYALRNAEVLRVYETSGLTMVEVGRQFGLSKRSVVRIIVGERHGSVAV